MTGRRVGLAVVVALMVAACGNGTAARVSSADAEGGVLRVGVVETSQSLNPWLTLTLPSGIGKMLAYPRLMEQDVGDGGWHPAPDLATSWDIAPDYRRITFHLRPTAKWSDGRPITARDAAWTINTTLRFRDGPTSRMAGVVAGIERATAPDPTTLVVDYHTVRSDALEAVGGVPLLPEHVWAPLATGDGRGLQAYRPDQHPGGMVTGGPYRLQRFDPRGTVVFVRDPDYYRPPARAKVLTLTLFTNADSMVHAFRAGEVDVILSVPTSAVPAVRKTPGATVSADPSFEQLDLLFNSNPNKTENRELLDPRVREALGYCINRQDVIDVVFHGYARKIETLFGSTSQYANRALPARAHDCAAGNRILDELGYRRGPDGVRIVPAGTQPAHRMAYEVVTPNSWPFNITRAATILRSNLHDLGIDATQLTVGDEPATWAKTLGADCDATSRRGYTGWDLWLDVDISDINPLDTLDHYVSSSWCAWNLTGFTDPAYDALYRATSRDPAQRDAGIMKLQEMYYLARAAYPIAEIPEISAHNDRWTGFPSFLLVATNKDFYTRPHLTNRG